MVKATKIDDEGNLGRWLEGQPREVSIWIAHRVAMRVAPIGWAYPFIGQHEGDLTTLPVLRCNLISGVESILPNSAETTAHAARSANYAATRAIRPGVKATGAATEAAAAAISAIGTHTSVAHTSAAAADYAASAAHAAAAAGHASTAEAFAAAVNIWLEVRTDALAVENAIDSTGSGNSSAYLPIGLRLWSGGNPLERFWTQTRDKWSLQGEGWHFWIGWYEDALAGREPDWKLLEKVALIENGVWEAGAEAVNARIGELRVERGLTKTGNGERVEINPLTGRLRLVRDSDLPEDIAQYAQRKIEKALSLFGDVSANQYTGLSPVFVILREAIDEAGNLPVELFDACASASRLTVGLGRQGDCPTPEQDTLVQDFLLRIREAGADILANDPKTQEVLTLRNQIMGNNALIEGGEVIAEAVAMIIDVAEGRLAIALPVDADVAANANADAEERKAGSYRLAGRLLRIAKIGIAIVGGAGGAIIGMREVLEAIPAITASPLFQQALAYILRYLGL